jgi:anti-sigma B factor antagonist
VKLHAVSTGACDKFARHQSEHGLLAIMHTKLYLVHEKFQHSFEGTMATKVTTLSEKGISVLEPKGSLIGGDEIDELKVKARELLDQGKKNLIVDLGGVDYLNSSGIGALVSILTSYSNAGGKVKLCNLGKNVHNVFVITKLTSVFDVEETRENAIKKF